MICLETDDMRVNDIDDRIVQWTVWFLTPEGSFPTLELARDSCKKISYPIHLIRPVPVALGSKIFEVVSW